MFKLYRTAGAVSLFILYIVGAVVLRFYAVTDINKRRVSVWWTSKICRTAAKFLNINVSSEDFSGGGKGRLIVSNHMSYLDILIYSSLRPAVYISSVEMEKTFFLGFAAKIGGTFFVERRNPKNIRNELNSIKELITQGFDVVLFPEGTSTDGTKILPFRSSFLASAAETGVSLVPACLRYDVIEGTPFNDDNKDYVCWYGDMSFAPHFFRFIGLKGTKVSAKYLAPIDTSAADRKTITKMAKELIESAYFGAA